MDFVNAHFPKLHLELSHPPDGMSNGRFSAYVHYARSRNEGPNGGEDWKCPVSILRDMNGLVLTRRSVAI